MGSDQLCLIKKIPLNVSYSWLVHIWSRILGWLLALRVGLLMRGMREFEWQLLIKLFSMAMGSRRLILRSPTMNTWTDCEGNSNDYAATGGNSNDYAATGGNSNEVFVAIYRNSSLNVLQDNLMCFKNKIKIHTIL